MAMMKAMTGVRDGVVSLVLYGVILHSATKCWSKTEVHTSFGKLPSFRNKMCEKMSTGPLCVCVCVTAGLL